MQVLEKINGYVTQMHDMIDQYKAALIAHVTSASGSQIKELNSKLMAQKVQLQKKVQENFEKFQRA